MERFQKIGVFLNSSPADDAVLSFGGRIAEIAGSDQVHAVHFREHGEGWEEAEPTEDQFAGMVKDRVPAAIAERITCVVRQGVGVREVLTTARDRDRDQPDPVKESARYVRRTRKRPGRTTGPGRPRQSAVPAQHRE